MTFQNLLCNNFVPALMAAGLMLAASAPALAQGGPRGYSQTGNNPSCCLPVSAEPVTAEEAKWLVFLREEEKLARDVYQQLFKKWNLRILNNIAQSEQRHFESIGTLMERYGVKDPVESTQAGVYADAELTVLYNQLIAKGNVSVKDALEVGVLIEKTDIADLENALKATSKADIKAVFTNLLAGSLNHQESFENTLEVVVAAP